MNALAQESGTTALYFAVRRGDVDVVNLLLKNGADPTIKNDIGKSPVDYCDAFPEVRGALKRAIQQRKDGNLGQLNASLQSFRCTDATAYYQLEHDRIVNISKL